MALIDNTLAAQVPQYNAVTPLAEVAKLQGMQAEAQAAQFKQVQTEIGSEARGLTPFVNTPEFPAKWAESMDRMAQRGLVNPQLHQQWRNAPSPLLLKQMISQTEDPTLTFRKDRAVVEDKQTDRAFGLQKANADRNYGLAVRAADRADEDKFTIKEGTDPNTGETYFERIKTTGPEGRIVGAASSSAPREPINPFANPVAGKTTGEQDKAAGFADRMLESEGILSGQAVPAGSQGPVAPGLQVEGTKETSAMAGAVGKVPLIGGTASKYLTSENKKSYDQAKMNFITAQLRRESGATILPSEFENEEKKYFPQVDDSEKIIQQKARARRTAIEAMAREGGRTYRPKYKFDESGVVIPRDGPAMTRAATKPPPNVRFNQLTASGLNEQQAYGKMAEEGY